jgi:hypothetical protein
MSKKKSGKKPLFGLPINVDIENTKIQEKKILEFVPNTVKPHEAIVVKAEKWGGLLKQSFVVLNIDGKELMIKQIKEETENPKPRTTT